MSPYLSFYQDAVRSQALQRISNITFSFPADGIALGAAVSTSRADVEMIVFIAIMLHKVNF